MGKVQEPKADTYLPHAGMADRKQLAYWKEKLAGKLPALDLPTERPRGSVQTYRRAMQEFMLGGELYAGLKALAGSSGASLERVLLAAFQVLLYRWSGQEDILMGWHVRRQAGGGAAGSIQTPPCPPLLPLRTDLGGEPGFCALLERVGRAMSEAQANSDLSVEELLEALPDDSTLKRPSLFEAAFIMEDMPLCRVEREDSSEWPPMHASSPGSRASMEEATLDLTLALREQTDGIAGRMEYNAALFEPATIQRMLGHFLVLLRGAIATPAESIKRLPLLSETERRQVLVEWNQTQAEYPRSKCVHQLFEAQVKRTPNAVAVVYEEEQLTYQELNKKADQLAAELQQLGVGPEVRVGLCVTRSLEMVIALYAIHKAGGAYVPLDPGYPVERLAFMLKDAQAAVLLTQQCLLGLLPATTAKVLCLDAPEHALPNTQPKTVTRPTSRIISNVTPDDLAYIIYTSGSTGNPKGVMVRHRNVVNLFTGLDQALGCEPGVWLAVTSISFDISVLELFWTLARGFTVVVHADKAAAMPLRTLREQECHQRETTQAGTAVAPPDSKPASAELSSAPKPTCTIAEQILRHGVTHMQCTPSLTGMMVQEPKTRAALGQVRQFLFGGEPLPAALVQQLAGAGEIFNMYGPTETTVWSTCHPVTRNGGTLSIGRPIANTQIYILDPHLQPVPVGVAGELFIGGAGVVRGYLNQPELTAERFIPDPFSRQREARLYRTGDLARYKADGTLEFLGRLDHQVKVRGYRIELGEIEAGLRQCPGVQESAVSVWEAAPGDKRLVGCFVPKPGTVLRSAELKRFLKSKLPDYMVPSVLLSLETMPLTPNGKLDREALPVPEARSGHVKPVAAHNASVARPGTEAKGDARRSGALRSGTAAPVKALPLTEAQREIWYAAQVSDAVSCSFNVSAGVSLKGPLDLSRLLQGARWLVERQEALRMTISPGGDAQHVHASVPVEVPLTDLSTLLPESRQQELEERLQAAAIKPFDLVRGPLWRAQLIRLTAEEHLLLLTVHHVVCDGFSLGILLQEWGEHYSAETKGEPAPQQTPVPFSEFILSQEAGRSRPERAEAEAYWLAQYSRPAAVLELPTDQPRPQKRTFEGGSTSLLLGLELSRELKRLSARQRCSQVATLLGVCHLLLWRLSGQPEVVIGLPMTCRSGAEADRLVGHCVNFLPLRLEAGGEASFMEHLGRVRQLLVEAHQHQDYTLGSLLQKLNLPRLPGRQPLASVMFNLNWAHDEPWFEGLATETFTNPHCPCCFDLIFNVTESRGQLKVQCQYSAELFLPETIQRWLKGYETLLAAIVARPEQRLSELARRLPPEPAREKPLQAEPPDVGPGAAGPSPLPPFVPPPSAVSAVEESLAEIWREVIVLEEVGRTDNFFDVGGHSLLATQVLSRIARTFNVELPLRVVFEAPTLAEMAGAICRAQREQPRGSTIITRRTREAKAHKLLERLQQLPETDLQNLLHKPKSKDSSV